VKQEKERNETADAEINQLIGKIRRALEWL